MHTKQWQTVCGFVTDICESVASSERTMRDLFDLITEDKGKVIYSWYEGTRQAYIRRDAFRRSVISVARKLVDCLPDQHGIVGLHIDNDSFWPICYWAILMSGHVPLLLDSQYELFHYRTMNECSGIYCITNDKNYPNIISPDFIKNSHSEVDSAYFDQLWANETIIVNEKNDGSLQAISHDGLSVSEQILRLSRVYQYNLSMLYPSYMGPAKVSIFQSFSDYFSFLCGIILYPCFNYELYLPGENEDIQHYFTSSKALSVTHHCISGKSCNEIIASVIKQIKKTFPKDATRYIAWLSGTERINDYRILAKYMSMSSKIRKTVFGKKIRCMLCADNDLDSFASHFFNQLGIFFGRGYWVPELGLISMELSCEAEARAKNSVGILLKGVVGMLMEDGRLVLDCGDNIGQLITSNGKEKIPSPFTIADKATFDQHNRLCILCNDQAVKPQKSQADPETIQKIRELYATVLEKPLEIIEEDMDFFSALGGDSLSYFLLLQHIELLYGIQIKPEERIYFSTARYAAETLKPYIQEKGVVTKNA